MIFSVGISLAILFLVISILVINIMIYISIGQYSDIIVEREYLVRRCNDISKYHSITFDELLAPTEINSTLINKVKDYSYLYRHILIYRINDKLASRIVDCSIKKLRKKIADKWNTEQ